MKLVREGRGVTFTTEGEAPRLQSYPLPQVEPGAILVSVDYAGVCGTDHHIVEGRFPVPRPVVLGHEAVGTVVAVGEGVSTDSLGNPLEVGQAVGWASSIPCRRCYYCRILQQPHLCEDRQVYGINISSEAPPHHAGGWGDFVYLRPGSFVMRLPRGVSQLEAISLGCAGPTAVHGVIYNTRIEPGDVVVVQGAGPVGIAAALCARTMGAGRLIMVGGPPERTEELRRLGLADDCIDIFEVPDPQEREELVLAKTKGGMGADVVLECAGVPAAVNEGLEMVRRGGEYLILGHYASAGTISFDPHLVTRKELNVRGSWGMSEVHFARYLELIPSFRRFIDLTKLVKVFPLNDSSSALESVAKGSVIKAVLEPTQEGGRA